MDAESPKSQSHATRIPSPCPASPRPAPPRLRHRRSNRPKPVSAVAVTTYLGTVAVATPWLSPLLSSPLLSSISLSGTSQPGGRCDPRPRSLLRLFCSWALSDELREPYALEPAHCPVSIGSPLCPLSTVRWGGTQIATAVGCDVLCAFAEWSHCPVDPCLRPPRPLCPFRCALSSVSSPLCPFTVPRPLFPFRLVLPLSFHCTVYRAPTHRVAQAVSG